MDHSRRRMRGAGVTLQLLLLGNWKPEIDSIWVTAQCADASHLSLQMHSPCLSTCSLPGRLTTMGCIPCALPGFQLCSANERPAGDQKTGQERGSVSPLNAYSSKFGSGCICSTKTVVSWAALSCAAALAGLPVPFHAQRGACNS